MSILAYDNLCYDAARVDSYNKVTTDSNLRSAVCCIAFVTQQLAYSWLAHASSWYQLPNR